MNRKGRAAGRKPGAGKRAGTGTLGSSNPRTPRAFQRSGVLGERELLRGRQVPDAKRLSRGPCVVIECVERIPCNPCASACPRKAITVEPELTDLPRVDFEKCNGCTLCVARCPGLAIFVVDHTYSDRLAAITLPWEMLPRPEPGSTVTATDRAGEPVCRAEVVRVRDAKALDRCALVTLAVPKKDWNRVRSFRGKGQRGKGTKGSDRRRKG